jgi:hypothetical protein
MATLDVTTTRKHDHLGVLRCTATGAVVMGVLFALCWAGAAAGVLNSSHMYVSLFTLEPIASASALAVGLCWSLVFGALAGALVALVYNAFDFIERGR